MSIYSFYSNLLNTLRGKIWDVQLISFVNVKPDLLTLLTCAGLCSILTVLWWAPVSDRHKETMRRRRNTASPSLTSGRRPTRWSLLSAWFPVCATTSTATSTPTSNPCCRGTSSRRCQVKIHTAASKTQAVDLLHTVSLSSLSAQGLDHIAENILSFLDARSLCSAELVCKEWQRVISEGMLWKKLIERMVRTDPLWKGLSERHQW